MPENKIISITGARYYHRKCVFWCMNSCIISSIHSNFHCIATPLALMTESTMITVGRWVGRWSKVEAFLLTSCWWWRCLAWQPQVGGPVPVGGEGDGGGCFYVQTSAAGVVLEYPGTRKQPLCGTPLSPESQVVDVDMSMRKDGRRREC